MTIYYNRNIPVDRLEKFTDFFNMTPKIAYELVGVDTRTQILVYGDSVRVSNDSGRMREGVYGETRINILSREDALTVADAIIAEFRPKTETTFRIEGDDVFAQIAEEIVGKIYKEAEVKVKIVLAGLDAAKEEVTNPPQPD